MKDKLIKLLAVLGVTLAADASDDAVITAANAAEPTITDLMKAKTDLAVATTAKADLETNVVTLTNAKAGLESTVATEKARADQAETRFKEERKQRAILMANFAVLEGRLPAAEREATVTALVNAADFAAETAKLEARTKQLRTQSGLSGLSEQGKASQNRQGQMLALINARLESADIQKLPEHERYDAAFKAVMEDPKNKGLVDAMHKPTATT